MKMLLKLPALLRDKCYINGEWVAAKSGETFDVTNPATGEVLASVPKCGAAETHKAITDAKAAQKLWAAKTAKERGSIIRRWRDLMIENQEDLARLMTAEQGKPLKEAMGEIVYAASFFEWYAEEAKRVYGDIIPANEADKRILVMRQPIGVVGAITPWNFPSAMITRKAGPALAAGCTMVVKPAEDTPLSALALAELGEKAGLPKGVFNVVTGVAQDIGGALCESPDVAKISFTGSTAVGKVLLRQCADTVKKLSLELGGNAPFIVFNDADVDAAVEGAMASKYRNTGQTCVCANRIYVQAGIYDDFAKKLAAAASELKVGAGLDGDSDQGPLINQAAVEKVESHVEDAVSKGAKVLIGGKRHDKGGTYFEPTVLTNVTSEMKVSNEETFGPLAPLFKFENEEDVVYLANNTRFGLASYFYTKDISRAFRVAEALEYGIVGLNTGIISTEVAPFGGVKESGLGREGSKYGIDEYVEMKYVCLAGV
ncbi:MAG: NAD-dependent succinate-semialdehyde dehydrogenase [Sphingomonadales bacterium]|jgi:succinate-semialdehyde dehydrogenase/glutarate-semialdehyde dehydrogenase